MSEIGHHCFTIRLLIHTYQQMIRTLCSETYFVLKMKLEPLDMKFVSSFRIIKQIKPLILQQPNCVTLQISCLAETSYEYK